MVDVRISGTKLKLSYGETPVLRGISVAIEAGQSTAIMGPSGSGKSTLLYCLAGLERPDRGSVICDGFDVWDADDDERSRWRLEHCGFVFQSADLVPELSLLDNVSLPLELLGMRAGRARARATDLLAELGVVAESVRRPTEVSGGQRQRAAIARALVADPDIVFADEPTGALDSANRDVVMDLLRAQARARDLTVILVTHDSEVATWMDQVIPISDGRLA